MNTNWVDKELYPFEHRYLEVDAGRLHYIDEGEGDPIVFVHGTPTWSFLWRDVIRELRRDYRCIALDHLGFGLSDKPEDGQYGPADHARNFASFVEQLGLQRFTLVVHDFGGPIALPYALDHPENVKRVALINTWLWANEAGRAGASISRLLSGPAGRFLYKRLNFSVRVLLRSAFVDRRKLARASYRHYLGPFPTPAQRQAPWVLARELTGSNDWYEASWNRRASLDRIPMLILWGTADKYIPPSQLSRWREAFPHAKVVPLEFAGHFVPEEAPRATIDSLRSFSETGRDEIPAGLEI